MSCLTIFSTKMSVVAFVRRAGGSMLESTESHGRGVERRVSEMRRMVEFNCTSTSHQTCVSWMSATRTKRSKAKQAKAKQRSVMGEGMCLCFAQLVQTKNKQCKSPIILQCYHPHLSDFCSQPRLTRLPNSDLYQVFQRLSPWPFSRISGWKL